MTGGTILFCAIIYSTVLNITYSLPNVSFWAAAPEGTQSYGIQGESIRPSVCPSIPPSICPLLRPLRGEPRSPRSKPGLLRCPPRPLRGQLRPFRGQDTSLSFGKVVSSPISVSLQNDLRDHQLSTSHDCTILVLISIFSFPSSISISCLEGPYCSVLYFIEPDLALLFCTWLHYTRQNCSYPHLNSLSSLSNLYPFILPKPPPLVFSLFPSFIDS